MKDTIHCINALDFALTSKKGDKWIKCPYKYKYELVHYLVRYQGWLYSDAIKLRKKQLYAIWYKNSEDK